MKKKIKKMKQGGKLNTKKLTRKEAAKDPNKRILGLSKKYFEESEDCWEDD